MVTFFLGFVSCLFLFPLGLFLHKEWKEGKRFEHVDGEDLWAFCMAAYGIITASFLWATLWSANQ